MNTIKYLFLVLLLGVFILGHNFSLAETVDQKEARLRSELAKVEAEISKNAALLSQKLGESASISRDIDVLKYQIRQAQLNIQAKELEIARLSGDINERVQLIGDLSEKIEEEKASLAELLRNVRDLDDVDLIDVTLGNDNISDLFADLDSFYFIQQSMHGTLASIRSTQNEAGREKIVLEGRKNAEEDARRAIADEKATVERKEAELQDLLRISRQEEDAYRRILAEREREREAIRSALFRLRDVPGISFGEALDLANLVHRNTGVRPAFLLAIITQESNLGHNVGTCNRPQDPPEKSWKNIMHPTRDIPPYQRIMTELGRPLEGTPLSCPLSVGWGGAMGPSQFIPSTWEPYKARISALTGNIPPDPWNPLDAFTASGLLLRDLGAAAGGYTNERTAALRYYAGGNWNNPHNAFYGDSVMRIAGQIQQQIDILQRN
ncbi:MAG TPA: hypothetical protein ENN31_01920 [Candidatus Vogelbacteria bacterium]|nr:hypothetical protein [Candidatus Vogelbacteria bacterium]